MKTVTHVPGLKCYQRARLQTLKSSKFLEPFGSGFVLRILALGQATSTDFPENDAWRRLLIGREPRFFVIKAHRHSRKWVFSGMFRSEAHGVRSKMTVSKISRV
jgi:hypothetical protein